MAFVCFVYLCDVRHLDKRIYKQCSGIYQEWQGRQRARVPPPSPFWGRATVRLPPSKFFLFFRANFFLFFLPYPIKAPIYPFSFPLRGFLFLCVYFLIRLPFRVSEGKNGEIRIVFPPILCLCGYYALYSHSLLFSYVVFFCCVFLLYLPVISLCVMFLYCLLLWMLCFSLICLFFCPLRGFLCFCV